MSAYKPREVISILQKLGFIRRRQTGSHIVMHNPMLKRTIPAPMHAKDVKKGLMKSIIKQANSTEQEFLLK